MVRPWTWLILLPNLILLECPPDKKIRGISVIFYESAVRIKCGKFFFHLHMKINSRSIIILNTKFLIRKIIHLFSVFKFLLKFNSFSLSLFSWTVASHEPISSKIFLSDSLFLCHSCLISDSVSLVPPSPSTPNRSRLISSSVPSLRHPFRGGAHLGGAHPNKKKLQYQSQNPNRFKMEQPHTLHVPHNPLSAHTVTTPASLSSGNNS